jgi:hypothetical protein
VQRGVLHDDRAADDVGVAAEVLRRRVHHGVGAELERALDRGRGERVVDDDLGPALHGVDDRLDVHDVQQWVRRRLDPDDGGLGPDRVDQGLEILLVDEVVAQSPAGEDLVDETVGAAVQVVRKDHVVAGLRGRRDQRVRRGHA